MQQGPTIKKTLDVAMRCQPWPLRKLSNHTTALSLSVFRPQEHDSQLLTAVNVVEHHQTGLIRKHAVGRGSRRRQLRRSASKCRHPAPPVGPLPLPPKSHLNYCTWLPRAENLLHLNLPASGAVCASRGGGAGGGMASSSAECCEAEL